MKYRLHFDIALEGMTQQEAIEWSTLFVDDLKNRMQMNLNNRSVGVKLSNDEDRGNKNYLQINQNGHASSKKIKF